MQVHVFRGTRMERVFASWDARRGTFTAYGQDLNDTIVWQIGQQADLPTIGDLRLALQAHRAFLSVEAMAALLGDQENNPATAPADADRTAGVAQ